MIFDFTDNHYAPRTRVLLDGVEVRFVVCASPSDGWLVAIKTKEDGSFDLTNGRAVYEFKTGKVSVVMEGVL